VPKEPKVLSSEEFSWDEV